ncbi:MAG: hypothetical protein ABFS35_10545 [Bacteroidota bacterium]
METKKLFINVKLKATFIFTMAFLMSVMLNCVGQKHNEIVKNAYELRMDGQADSAKVLLEKSLKKDSISALVWFELCRTNQHIGLANPRKMVESMDEILHQVNMAVKFDSENVYYLSYRGSIEVLNLYMSLMTGKNDGKDKLTKVEKTYNAVLKLKPDYYEVKLTLVELFGALPEDKGGDKVKAEKYATELEKEDVLHGAKAREILMNENDDKIAFWESINKKLPDNSDVYEAMGRSYLHKNKSEEAKKCFKKAIALNTEKSTLHLELGRYYMMQAMRNAKVLDSITPLIEEEFNKYLSCKPEANKPTQAWVVGNLAKIKYRTGDKEAGKKLMDKANGLDLFFSKAFAVPNQALFSPPGKIVRWHSYYFRPF